MTFPKWLGLSMLVIVLDQFPRNIWRGSAHAFATDPLARSIAAQALGGPRLAEAVTALFA